MGALQVSWGAAGTKPPHSLLNPLGSRLGAAGGPAPSEPGLSILCLDVAPDGHWPGGHPVFQDAPPHRSPIPPPNGEFRLEVSRQAPALGLAVGEPGQAGEPGQVDGTGRTWALSTQRHVDLVDAPGWGRQARRLRWGGWQAGGWPSPGRNLQDTGHESPHNGLPDCAGGRGAGEAALPVSPQHPGHS